MQHWMLAECLALLQQQFESLHFVTTHSMSPWAFPATKEKTDHCRSVFLKAAAKLATTSPCSTYESAWKKLSVAQGLPYPSSAVFANELWQGDLSMSLCEVDTSTANDIDGWLSCPHQIKRLKHSVLLRGDWRASLANPLLWKTSSSCMYFEMDPMRYDAIKRKKTEPANLYPNDIARLIKRFPKKIPALLQISSFSTQSAMPLERQKASLEHMLTPAGFALQGECRVKDGMISIVFARDIHLQLSSADSTFKKWIDGIR